MDFLSDISPVLNGGFSAFNLYILFRIMNIEKEVEREKGFFLDFRKNEEQTNQDIIGRLFDIEFELSKRFSTWNKKYRK